MRAARCHHGRPRAGAGVHDPRLAGVGQVGPRVVASLETPGVLSPRRGLWAPPPRGGRWPERGSDPRAGVPGPPLLGSRGLGLEEGLFWSFLPHSFASREPPLGPGPLIAVGGIKWLRFMIQNHGRARERGKSIAEESAVVCPRREAVLRRARDFSRRSQGPATGPGGLTRTASPKLKRALVAMCKCLLGALGSVARLL